ncbi:MAG: hypothetical protein GX116_01180 [Fibrobacter sp.]|nr:hypothetical protein [Fibrobacter sp.]
MTISMNKRIVFFAVAVIALVACSESKSSGVSVGTEPSVKTSSIKNAVGETSSDAEIAFMNNMLDSFARSHGAVVSDEIGEATPTDGATISLSPVLFDFATKKEVLFNEIKSNGSCWVNLYDEENGISFYKSKREGIPGYNTILEESDDARILFKENEGSLYRQDWRYKDFAGKREVCVADSIAFVSECNEKNGVYRVYNGDCGASLEMSCVVKVSSQTELRSIANKLKNECEKFIADLPEAKNMPTVHCQGDTENGMVCDTTWNK